MSQRPGSLQQERTYMKIVRNKYDYIINLLSLLCLIGISIFLIIAWDKIPAKIPGHYNFAGEIDKFSDKSSLKVLLAADWIFFILISVVEMFPGMWNTGVQVTPQNREKVYRILKNMLGTLKLCVVLVFSYLTYHSTSVENMPVLFLPVFMILIFGPIGFFIYQLMKV